MASHALPPLPLDAAPPAWTRWLTLAASAAVFAFLGLAVAKLGWGEVLAVLPANPLFYALLFAAYLTLPLSEALIFRRVWGVGWSVVPALVRKRVLNDVVFGYSGEAWLFMWARARARLKERALAAVKDVSITSALAGNVATVALLGLAVALAGGFAAASALLGGVAPGVVRGVAGGVAVVMAVSVGVLMLRGKLLSLTPSENRLAFGVAVARLALAGLLVLLAWWIALPAVALSTWLLLGALRLVVSRLPLVPNKDLLFTGLAVALTGAGQPAVAALLAATAAFTLVFHGLTYAAVAALDFRRTA